MTRLYSVILVAIIGVLMQTPRCAAASTNQLYRVVCDDGRYWFVRGDEQLLLFGVNCVDAGAGTTSGWARVQSWGFNVVAGWSDERLYAQGMPHTRVAWLGGWGAAASALVDVFSDEYLQRFNESVARDIMPHTNEAGLIGWFANNEMAWYGDFGWPSDPTHALLYKYCSLPSNAPGKQALVAFLRARAGNNLATFNTTWAPAIRSFSALGACTTLQPRTVAAQIQILDWTGVVADRYFAMARAAIYTNSPGTLFLGVRFAGGAPRAVLEACGRYADVVSLNLYRKDGTIDIPYLDNIYALTKKPLLITEFSWRAMENASGNPNSRGADVTVATQADRAKRCTAYCTALAKLPYCLGWDWFQYGDQPPGGRFDGEDSNYGLVSIHDQPYPLLTKALAAVHARAGSLHGRSPHSLPTAFNPAAWYELRSVTVRRMSSGARVQPKIIWPRPFAAAALNTWADENAGAKVRATVVSNMLRIVATPKGWGCGVDLPLGRAHKTDGINAAGILHVHLRARIPAGNQVVLMVSESGAAALGEQTYSGLRGADGESFCSPPLVGTGAWVTYDLPLANFTLNTAYGNQRGNCVIDTQALRTLGVFLSGTQPACALELATLTLAP